MKRTSTAVVRACYMYPGSYTKEHAGSRTNDSQYQRWFNDCHYCMSHAFTSGITISLESLLTWWMEQDLTQLCRSMMMTWRVRLLSRPLHSSPGELWVWIDIPVHVSVRTVFCSSRHIWLLQSFQTMDQTKEGLSKCGLQMNKSIQSLLFNSENKHSFPVLLYCEALSREHHRGYSNVLYFIVQHSRDLCYSLTCF